jgi:1,4-alpha-glucan branching enzyme
MFEIGRKRGTVRFSFEADTGVRQVSVAGDFTDWQPVRLRKRGNVFSVTVPVPPGSHEYKLIVDGEWRTDPDNVSWAVNPFGTLNSVAMCP